MAAKTFLPLRNILTVTVRIACPDFLVGRNITNLQRNGVTATGLLMDNFAYKYEETLNGGKNNRLSWVDDLAGTSVYADADIDNSMNAGNYAYDKLGQLVRDTDEGIAGIEWRLGDKKIKRITRNDANSSQLEFVYNPFGQRVLKIEKPRTGGAIQASTTWKYTYYTYDANGQVMAVYDVRIGSPFIQSAYLEEQHLYGASRLGMIKPHKPLHTGILGGTDVFSHTEGQTYYELANYLGNVEAVITDRKTWKLQGTEEIYFDQFTTPGDLLGWAPENPPFSANPPAVDYSLVALGGELIVYAGSTPAYWGTVFKDHFFEDGADYELSFDVDISMPGIYVTAGNATSNVFLNTVNSSGSYSFTFTGNGQMLWYGFICASGQVMKLDNIRLKKTESHAYDAVVVNTADYYPYGMVMPGRHTQSVDYRFAYNGMETDKEVKGGGNSYTTEFRQYDPRLGRWLSLDPLMHQFPWMSPYVAFDNNPIYYTDIYGLSAGGPPEVTGSEDEGDVNGDYTFHCGETSEYDGWYKNIEGPTIRPALSEVDIAIQNFQWKTSYMDKHSLIYMQQEAMFKLQLYALQNSDAVHSRKMSMPKPIDASLDDDRINFFVLGAGAGANAVTYGVNADIKNIWVPKDVDNIHVHNSGRFYLTYGFSYGKNAADALAEMSISAQIGYGFMENVHPYDDLGAIFENAADFEISYSAGSSSLGMVIGKSKGKNGTVPIYFFFGDYGQGLKTKQKMPMALPVNIKGGIFSKELKRNVSVIVNAADTGKAIINNPSNNLPAMTMDEIKRMDQILMKK